MNIPEVVKTFLRSRRQAYITVFTGPAGEAVLKDLARFCRAHSSTWNANPALSDKLDGRREVILRIFEHINLTEDQLYKLYGRNIDD